MKCETRIDLQRPNRARRVRGFQPPWRTVFDYRCPACGSLTTMRASAFRGKYAEPGIGATICGAERKTP